MEDQPNDFGPADMITVAKCVLNEDAPFGVTFTTPLSVYPPQDLRYAVTRSKHNFVQEVFEIFDNRREADDYAYAMMEAQGWT